MAFTFDKKYLSIFTERLIPGFVRERFPNYQEFIKIYLEFLEQDPNGIYTKMNDVLQTKDLVYIKNLTDPVLQDQLLEALYISLFGESKARYLSNLLNDYEFIGNLGRFTSLKGTKAAFQMFFLLFMKRLVRIIEYFNRDKIHDGTWLYDGTINYDNRDPNAKVPFVYKLESEIQLAAYQDLMYLMHPTGFVARHFLMRVMYVNRQTGNDYMDYFNLLDPYMVFYDGQSGSNYVGHARIFRTQAIKQLANDATDFDWEFIDETKWNTVDTTQTGADFDAIMYDTTFNQTEFGSALIKDVDIIDSPNPHIFNYYTSGISPYTPLVQGSLPEAITVDTFTNFKIVILL